MVNKTLLVIKSPPYGSGRAAEGLRMATAMIAMDVMPKILFIDDGVYCLLKDQKPEAAGLTSFEDRLKTLADLAGLHVASNSLMQRELTQTDIAASFTAKPLSQDEIAQMISQNEAVITF